MDHTADESRWRAAVAKVLKGADPAGLTTRSRDGLAIEPLYAKAEAAVPGPWRDTDRPFRVMQRLDHPDLEAAAAQARADVAGGASGLVLVGAGGATARGFGLPLREPGDLDTVLDGIDLAAVALRFEGVESGLVLRWIEQRGSAPADVALGLDPLTSDGGLPLLPAGEKVPDRADEGDPSPQRGEGAPLLGSILYYGGALNADGRPHHEAGASEAQELAAVLSAGVAGLRALEPLGLEVARGAIGFTLVADTDLDLTVAKLRALRRLWARVEACCGLAPRPLRLHAETAWRSLARPEPHTNLLRQAIAAAGAIVGGADTLAVLPFTSALGLPDAFARRLARNTPLVLLDEAGLGRVADSAAGAGGIEGLTDALCHEAWRLFQELERGGGLAAALAAGRWQADLEATRRRRHDNLAEGRARLVGVTAFRPAVADQPPVLAPAPADRPPAPGRLPSIREAAAFEAAP